VPVWIDIWPRLGIETASLPTGQAVGGKSLFCRIGYTRGFSRILVSGLPNDRAERGLSTYQECPMKVRNSLKSLRGRHRNNRLVRRKGRVYVINKVQRRFKARQG